MFINSIMPKNTNTRKNKNTKNTKKSTKATKKVEEVVVEDVVETTPVETPVVTKQTGGKTKASKSTKATKSTKSTKSTASKTTKKSTKKEEPVVETETATETQTGGPRKRTFKAMLPGETEYSGRFTGSTPYQAASKAVTKYHKLHKNNKKEIKFSIKESTQGSKKNVGHYFGQRVKQQNPVSYEVSDNGNTRVISKDFKNVVKKIMKAQLSDIPENSYIVS